MGSKQKRHDQSYKPKDHLGTPPIKLPSICASTLGSLLICIKLRMCYTRSKSEPSFKVERNCCTARTAFSPVTPNFSCDRAMLVDLKREASRDLGRVIVLVGVECISKSIGNGVPSYVLSKLEIQTDTQDIVRERCAWVLLPPFPTTSTCGQGRGIIERNAVANRSLKILARPTAKGRIAIFE